MVRIFGSSGRGHRLRSPLVAIAAITAMVIGIGLPAALASHPEVSLPGSDFEIDTDANLKVDDPAPSIDWANVTEVRKLDTASGALDESFGQGTKEDTANPTVVNGSIPPNKSDLKAFGIYQEGEDFLHMFWARVQDPTGTTNMDFEFNQNKCDPGDPTGSVCATNGITPARLAGDLLIIYDLSRGGTQPTLSLRTWNGSSWGPAESLTASGEATGSINTSSIPGAEADGLGPLDPRTFGEASVDLSAILDPTECSSFGSAYLKSRSSDSFTAALKDFVPPASIDIGRCGSVKVTKTDDADPPNPLAGAEFTLYEDNPPIGGTRGVEDSITTQTCTTDSTGVCTIEDVLAGEYWVVETVTPAGHDTAADQHVTVVADEEVSVTFVDPRLTGAIRITKTRKHAADGPGDHPHAGVDFTVDGTTVTTDANGQACVDGLLFDDYTVSETVPTGYAGEADKTVTVDTASTCGDGNEEEVSFSNTPLTNLTVSVDSQVAGGTSSTIDCDPAPGTDAGPGDDISHSLNDLEPGTITCTIVIDP
jgi:hypothetical protein